MQIQTAYSLWTHSESATYTVQWLGDSVTHMLMLGGELCTTISVWISGTMDPGGGTTPPAVSKSTSGACRGAGTCTYNSTHTAQIYRQTDRYGHNSKPKPGRRSQQVLHSTVYNHTAAQCHTQKTKLQIQSILKTSILTYIMQQFGNVSKCKNLRTATSNYGITK
jgi:hypothetical protein